MNEYKLDPTSIKNTDPGLIQAIQRLVEHADSVKYWKPSVKKDLERLLFKVYKSI